MANADVIVQLFQQGSDSGGMGIYSLGHFGACGLAPKQESLAAWWQQTAAVRALVRGGIPSEGMNPCPCITSTLRSGRHGCSETVSDLDSNDGFWVTLL